MHTMILFVMNISFFETMALYVLFIDMGTRRHSPCLVLFDGVCNFCNGFTVFLQKHDPQRALYFVASQSEAGQELMRRQGISEKDVSQTVYTIEEGRVSSRSAAILRIASRLSLPWWLVSYLWIVPPFLRDAVYQTVSANRYRWFGKSSECRIPSPEERARFIQTSEELKRYWTGAD